MRNFISLLMLLLVLSGCSLETLNTDENLITANARPSLKEVVVPETFEYDPICAGVAADFCFSFPQLTAGSNNKDTQVQIQLYFYGDDPESSEDDGYEQIFKDTGATSVCADWMFEEPGAYDVRYKIGSGGFTNLTIQVEDCNNCEEDFHYIKEGGNEYTFYYTPSEAMEEANLTFTFAQSAIVSGLDGWVNKGQTEQMTMDLEECVTYSWTVNLSRNCSGYSGNSNVWTDFKVNDESKKTLATPNIVQACE